MTNVTRRALLAAAALVALGPRVAQASPEAAAAEAELSAALAEVDALGDAIERTMSELAETEAAIVAVGEAASDIECEMVALDSEVSALEDEVAGIEGEVADALDEIEDLRDALAEQMSSAYKQGQASWLDVLLGSATLSELSSRVRYLDDMSAATAETMEAIEAADAEVFELRATLKDRLCELSETKDGLALASDRLSALEGELEAWEAVQAEQAETAQATTDEATALLLGLSEEASALLAADDAELAEAVEEARGAKEEADEASERAQMLQALVDAAYSTPTTGAHLCAKWVTNVFRAAGIGSWSGNACDLFWSWCDTSFADIEAGMIVAVNTVPYGTAATIYGHVGIYVGDGLVRDNAGGTLRTSELWDWYDEYDVTATPRCGWLGDVELS